MRFGILLFALLFFLFNSCTSSEMRPYLKEPEIPAPGIDQPDFSTYVSEYSDYIRQVKIPILRNNPEYEFAANSPFEIRPKKSCEDGLRRGILLSHGLNDSAYQMKALAEYFAENCFLARVLTLDGHGTNPGDLLDIKIGVWQKRFQFGVESFRGETDLLFLGGQSTSTNLAMYYALKNPEIDGLAFFSPAFRPYQYYPNLLGFLEFFIDWLVVEEKPSDYTKYLSFSVRSLALYTDTVEKLTPELKTLKAYPKPVFMAMSKDDSVIDVEWIRKLFTKKFTHPDSKIHYYRRNPQFAKNLQDPRIEHFQSFLPEKKIYEISHLSLTYSPQDPHYGKTGDFFRCRIAREKELFEACKNAPREQVWKGDWGVLERAGKFAEGKVFGRLTYNPYFDEMKKAALQTLMSVKPKDIANLDRSD